MQAVTTIIFTAIWLVVVFGFVYFLMRELPNKRIVVGLACGGVALFVLGSLTHPTERLSAPSVTNSQPAGAAKEKLDLSALRESAPVGCAHRAFWVGVPCDALHVPPGLGSYPQDLQGLFPATGVGCCWASQYDRFKIAVPKGAASMSLRVWIPPDGYANGEQGVTAVFSGSPPQARHALPTGTQTVTFSVPKASRGKSTTVEIFLDASFVPAEKHINADTTSYGVALQRVDFR